jgi:hypothetical protein
MVSSGVLRRVALVRNENSEELGAPFIRVTRGTRRNIPEDTILHSHRRENLKPYIIAIFPNRTVALGSPQLLTEMSTRNIPVGKGRPALEADYLTANLEPIMQDLTFSRR